MSCAAAGCVNRPKPASPAPKQAAAPTYTDQPVLDFRRGGTGLPLPAGALPDSRPQFVSQLLRAYAARLVLPQKSGDRAAKFVAAEGSYPRLSRLHIDVSGAKGRRDYKPRQTKTEPAVVARLAPALWVADFAYVAEPLRYEHGEMDLRLTGRNATFGLVKEPDGSGTLVMIDAAGGEMVLSAEVSQLRAMLLGGARNHAKGGFWVRDVDLSVTSDHPRAVAVSLRVKAMWTLLPMTFRLGGRITVDDAFNAHLTGVFIRGEDPGGMLVAAMVGPDMRKEGGRVRPLARFPNDRLELKDVSLTGGQRMTLAVKFGRAAAFASAPRESTNARGAGVRSRHATVPAATRSISERSSSKRMGLSSTAAYPSRSTAPSPP